AKGLTQEEVAEKCGITIRTIQRIESGLVEPRVYTIKIISETMRKISILTATLLLITLLCVNFLNAEDQSEKFKNRKSLSIEVNNNSVKRVEVAFTHSLNLDSLIKIKRELEKIGIVIHYKKIEFNVHNLLVNLDCEVICNDGFSGSFGTGSLSSQNSNKRIGFYRDYSPDAKSPFGTGFLD
ncbi:MAG: helix-turn-helix transcriptional regulator, partial [Parabacteroides sp.]|nr:helix-turn-helix transcriptional regulator [Parabacteroides sp.]